MRLTIIPEAPQYQISNEGTVYNKLMLPLKPEILKNGYLRIMLKINGIKVRLRLHRLVATHYVDNPLNKPQVNHLDGNKSNNHYTNLQWVTNQENMIHAVNTGLINYDNHASNGKKYGPIARRPVLQQHLNGELIKRYSSVREAKKESRIQIAGALSGRYKTAGGFLWKYE